jgi:protein TonB
MEQPLRDRIVAAVGAVLVVVALGLSLLFGLRTSVSAMRDTIVVLLDFKTPPPPPLRHEPPEAARMARPARNAPSPRNLRNKPTDIVVPPPLVIPPPLPQPVVAAPVAGTGAAPSAGASDRPGPGFGAGGEGNGSGGGGDGDGEGEGDDTPPIQIGGRLKFGDMPPELRVLGETRWVSVRYRVNIDGRVSDCIVTRSSGNPRLDAVTCSKIEERFRFRPSRDSDGTKVRSIVVETHQWRVGVPDVQPQSR